MMAIMGYQCRDMLDARFVCRAVMFVCCVCLSICLFIQILQSLLPGIQDGHVYILAPSQANMEPDLQEQAQKINENKEACSSSQLASRVPILNHHVESFYHVP